MAYVFIRLDEKKKKKIRDKIKKLGYHSMQQFVEIAIDELISRDQKLLWRLDNEKKTRGSAGCHGL